MSNGLSLAAVTSTLRYVLERSLAVAHPGPVGSASVSTLRPDRLSGDELDGAPGLNIFLYQVTPNNAGSLADLPTRRSDGSLAARPTTALDLHYLLTGYGQDPSLDGQRLLGRAITALAVSPVLTRDVITAAVDAYSGDAETTFLSASNLAEQAELVKVTMIPLPLEELSRLWGVFQQTPYQLSVAYRATVVLLEADVPIRRALPVRTRSLTLDAAGPPRLDFLATDDGGPPRTGAALLLRGGGLRMAGAGPVTRVRVGPAMLEPTEASVTEVRVILDDTVPAGLHSCQVQLRTPAGPPAGPPQRVVAASNALPVEVRPTVTVGAVTADSVRLDFEPPLFSGQRAEVELGRLDAAAPPAPRHLVLALDPVPQDASPRTHVELDRADLPAEGRWLVRLQVDGVESLPTLVEDAYGTPELDLT